MTRSGFAASGNCRILMPASDRAKRSRNNDSWASSEHARRTMVANRGRDTGPEIRLRRELHRRGLRYRVNVRPVDSLRRTADIVFRSARVAIFVDGCFWHGCSEHRGIPKTNRQFWSRKIARTRERDRETTRLLEEEGWQVVRVWEHEEPLTVAEKLKALVRSRPEVSHRGRCVPRSMEASDSGEGGVS